MRLLSKMFRKFSFNQTCFPFFSKKHFSTVLYVELRLVSREVYGGSGTSYIWPGVQAPMIRLLIGTGLCSTPVVTLAPTLLLLV